MYDVSVLVVVYEVTSMHTLPSRGGLNPPLTLSLCRRGGGGVSMNRMVSIGSSRLYNVQNFY
jgi:hypothetical protein